MKTYMVVYCLDGSHTRVMADEAEWAEVLKFKKDGRVVAVFFSPVYFMEVQGPSAVSEAA